MLVIDQGEEVFTLAQTPEDLQRGRQALEMLRRTVQASGDFKVIFEVTALDTADADETYSLVVDVDSLAAFTDAPVEVADITVTATGTFEIPLSGDYLASLDVNAAAIRVGAVLGGTTSASHT